MFNTESEEVDVLGKGGGALLSGVLDELCTRGAADGGGITLWKFNKAGFTNRVATSKNPRNCIIFVVGLKANGALR